METLVVCLLVLISAATLNTCGAQRSEEAHRFRNVALDPTSGLRYRRAPSRINAQFQQTLRDSLEKPIPFQDQPKLPFVTYGQPGVAVGDFNNDGYDDIYVTNGPGAANSLFLNELPTSGELKFSDRALALNVASTSQDSTGVCYGDLNRDGYPDFVVLSEYDANAIFLSTGPTGRYEQLDWATATGSEASYASMSCAIGDLDGDGWLDLAIANGAPRNNYLACVVEPFKYEHPNQVFLNSGAATGLKFKDATESSGINNVGGDVPSGKNTISWAISILDVNQDGHVDIVVADDQCGYPTRAEDPVAGVDRGAIRLHLGNGKGVFRSRDLTPTNPEQNNRRVGGESWMGLGFGDLNCDGKIDVFGSNFGDYHSAKLVFLNQNAPVPNPISGWMASRWWIGDGKGGFTDASVREHGVTVFGWGNAIVDYDNDGDHDIFSVGSLDEFRQAGSTNPNLLWVNSRCGSFKPSTSAFAPSGTLRNYQGLAHGDFNLDGHPDLASASGYISKPSQLSRPVSLGDPFDATAFFTDILTPAPPQGNSTESPGLVWNGNTVEQGDLMVQVNTAVTNCFVSVRPLGMLDLVPGARTNRGGLGSSVTVYPRRGKRVISPITGGESFGSQHSARRNFGLGSKCRGDVVIRWAQGGVDRLRNVVGGDVLTVPETGCGRGRGRKWENCVRAAMRAATGWAGVDETMAKTVYERIVGNKWEGGRKRGKKGIGRGTENVSR